MTANLLRFAGDFAVSRGVTGKRDSPFIRRFRTCVDRGSLEEENRKGRGVAALVPRIGVPFPPGSGVITEGDFIAGCIGILDGND